MTWCVTRVDETSMTLQLNFTNPLAVSTDMYSYDEIAFNIKKPKEFIVLEENRPMKWSQQKA